jgi:predicted nucleic-acid-binding Zn-ribbon protein
MVGVIIPQIRCAKLRERRASSRGLMLGSFFSRNTKHHSCQPSCLPEIPQCAQCQQGQGGWGLWVMSGLAGLGNRLQERRRESRLTNLTYPHCPMKSSGKCPKCQSTEIISSVTAVDYTHSGEVDQTLATFSNPGALFFKGRQSTTVSAWVCASCGLVEYYARNPTALILPDSAAKHTLPKATAWDDWECLSCGKLVPNKQTSCPHCGWTYQDRERIF